MQKWAEWRERLREREEGERENILKAHDESQKLRLIKSSSHAEMVGGTSKCPAEKSVPLSDIVPAVRKLKAPKEAKPRKSAEDSGFEADIRRAASQLKLRIDAQVSLVE